MTKSASLYFGCKTGHDVFLNRGYRFEQRDTNDKAFENENWSSSEMADKQLEPLSFLRNFQVQTRSESEGMGPPLNGHYYYHAYCASQERGGGDNYAPWADQAQMGAMRQADINADGRVDLIFSYFRIGDNDCAIGGNSIPGGDVVSNGCYVKNIYLNTARGFEKIDDATRVHFPTVQYRDFTSGFAGFTAPFISSLEYDRGTPSVWRTAQFAMSDLGRFVDIDNDGLQDLVVADICETNISQAPGGGGQADIKCKNKVGNADVYGRGVWYKNTGVVPDLMTSESTQSGAWTEITYENAPIAKSTWKNKKNPNGLMVVEEITRGAQPHSNSNFERIEFEYGPLIRSARTARTYGFESVSANFYHMTDGVEYPLIKVKREFETNAEDVFYAHDSTLVSHIDHPYRGQVHRTTVCPIDDPENCFLEKSTTFSLRLVADSDGYEVARPQVDQTLSTECELSTGVCVTSGTIIEERDSLGFPIKTISGKADPVSKQINTNDKNYVETFADYEHRRDIWKLGLPIEESISGYSSDFDTGTSTFGTLSKHASTYDIYGALSTATRPDITSDICPPGVISDDQVITYTRDALGFVTQVRNGGLAIETVPDNFHLYPQSKSVRVGRYNQIGQPNGNALLTELFEHDLRFGNIRRTTDVNGKVFRQKFDSFGRPLEVYGPPEGRDIFGTLLTKHHYDDVYPPTISTTTYYGGSDYSLERTFFDGYRRPLATLVGHPAHRSMTRVSAYRYDGAGRKTHAYHPVNVKLLILGQNISNVNYAQVEPNDQQFHDNIEYDALDRPLYIVKASEDLPNNGLTTAFEYTSPQQVIETKPRGNKVRRSSDVQGNLIQVEHLDWNDQVLSNYEYDRDGLGRITEIRDPDQNIRRLAYDPGGRIDRLSLPHKSTSLGNVFLFCHDENDHLVGMTTPGGDTVETHRDNLGRVYRTTASNTAGTEESFVVYGGSAQNANGRVRLTLNNAGRVLREYDQYGRTSRVEQQLSSNVLAGSSNLPSTYVALFDYGRQGNLNSVEFTGLGARAELAYERDVLGRVKRVLSYDDSGATTLVDGIVYNAHNAVTKANLGNGNSAHWSFLSGRNLLDRIEHRDADGDIFGGVEYMGYDSNDNLLGELRLGEASTILADKMHTYDALDRLIKTEGGVQFRAVLFDEDYTYSPGGNISTAASDVYYYARQDLPQAVTQVDTGPNSYRQLQYDNSGRMIHEDATNIGFGVWGTHHSATDVAYDAAGCMTRIDHEIWATGRAGTRTVSDQTTRHVCGEGGRRVLRETTDNLTGETQRVIDFAGLAEIRPDEGIMLWRVPVNGAVTVEEARFLATGVRDDDQSGYIHPDLRGSTLAKTGWDAQMSLPFEEAEYDAWGKTLRVSTNSVPTHQFVGFEPDPATGWYFMGARVYDPTLRRWLSPDPLLLAAPQVDVNHGISLNLYAYADNEPVRLIDPDGTKPFAQAVGSGTCGRDWDCTSESYAWTRGSKFDEQLKNAAPVFGVMGDAGDLISAGFYALAVVENPTWDNAKAFGEHAAWSMVPIAGAGVSKGLLNGPTKQLGKAGAEALNGIIDVGRRRVFKGDEGIQHFEKHAASFMKVLGKKNFDMKEYMDSAHDVIKYGTYLPDSNAFVMAIPGSEKRGKGGLKFGFVGLDRVSGDITTFHIKDLKQIKNKSSGVE